MMDDYDTFIKQRAMQAQEATLGTAAHDASAQGGSLFDGLNALANDAPANMPEYGLESTEALQTPSEELFNPALHSGLLNKEHENLSSSESVNKPATQQKMRLGDKLISLGLISQDQLDVALQEQKQTKTLLGTILTEFGFITESALAEVLAEESGVERFNAKNTMIDPNVIKMIPKEVATRHKVVPVAVQYSSMQVAMTDIYDVIAVDAVRRHLPKGMNVSPLYCTETEIQELINRYYDYEISITGILNEIETGIRDKRNILDGNQEGYVSPTVRLVNALLIDAVKQGASDLHFEPEGTFLRLRYRIDGNLVQIRTFHRDYWSAIAVRIKIMSGMNIAETRVPQDGRITFNAIGREVDFRVATQPTVFGENIVMRLLDKSKSILPLEYLGFSEHNLNLIKKLLKRPEGIIIMTGPTGSGKTTTLYSLLNYINSIDVNIMTLEDPVEYELPLIRQTNVKEGIIGFSSGIKSLMRQDPDIIFIGEVRDEDTALNAVRAALTGHQVFSTLHTNDAVGIIARLNDIGVPSHMLAGSLICGVSQRLARKLCNHCKTPRPATPEECKILGHSHENPPTVYEAVGCPHCKGKGYKGRIALVEIMAVDKGMDELIATRATRNQMLEHLLSKGFIPMIEDGIEKILAGEIDVKELVSTVDVTDRL
jgi:general secretion pathway protein E/type IV pilus assembly protein PilB